MLGLKYIRKDIFNMSAKELANKLNISRQAIMDWESKRSKLLDYRLEELEKIFGVSKKWYSKELDDIDKLRINNEVLNNVMTGKDNEVQQKIDINNKKIDLIKNIQKIYKKGLNLINNNDDFYFYIEKLKKI